MSPAEIERSMVEDLDRRRVVTLARLGLMLSVMAGHGPEIVGFDAAELYAEVMMALGVEDCDEGTEDIQLEVARDYPEGCMLSERFDAMRVAADLAQGEAEMAHYRATTCACTAAERYVETCPKHGLPSAPAKESE